MNCSATARRADHNSAPDTGATFIEVLVSIVLLGTAGIAVLTALAAATASASTHRDLTAAQAALALTADALERRDDANDTYVECAEPSDYTGLIPADADGASIAAVDYWTGTGWSGSNCRHDDGQRLQRVTIVAAVGDVEQELQVVKRPAAAPTAGLGPLPESSGGSVEFSADDVTYTDGIEGSGG